MNPIHPETLKKITQLAQLEIEEQARELLEKELTAIFPLFDALNRSDIKALPPLAHPLEDTQRLREDKAEVQNILKNLAQNAPEFKEDFIIVPKVIAQ